MANVSCASDGRSNYAGDGPNEAHTHMFSTTPVVRSVSGVIANRFRQCRQGSINHWMGFQFSPNQACLEGSHRASPSGFTQYTRSTAVQDRAGRGPRSADVRNKRGPRSGPAWICAVRGPRTSATSAVRGPRTSATGAVRGPRTSATSAVRGQTSVRLQRGI